MRDKRSSKPNGLGYITWSNPPGLLSKEEEGDGRWDLYVSTIIMRFGGRQQVRHRHIK
jgi:hypothetical protein